MSTSNKVVQEIPEGLAKISQGRDIVTAKEAAKVTNNSTQTIRKHLSEKGNFHGIKPVKIGNRLHFWVMDLAKLLKGEKHD
jgi:Fic family protein